MIVVVMYGNKNNWGNCIELCLLLMFSDIINVWDVLECYNVK